MGKSKIMGFNLGIVGLPNVGKSTIFNALTRGSAKSDNFPFCTIDPNRGFASIADKRLDRLAEISDSKTKTPTRLEIVDIAGLVKGASEGEGLGNEFLGHIRAVDAIAHVTRLFTDPDVALSEGSLDPERDLEIVQTELLLADIASISNRIAKLEKGAVKSGDKEARDLLERYRRLRDQLERGVCAIDTLDESERSDPIYRSLSLLTMKPVVYVVNLSESESDGEDEALEKMRAHAHTRGAPLITIRASIERELAFLSEEERAEFLESYRIEESALDRVVRAGYAALDLVTFFTTGPKETRAWTIRKGALAPQAAGVIHSDFERGFIRAETISYEDFDRAGSEKAARSLGLMRLEGKNYPVRDGDVFHFRFNV